MSNEIWSKDYNDLEKAGRSEFYSAVVRPHHWTDCYIFQAIPHRGGWCVECISEDKEALVSAANAWLAGESPSGFYSSSL